MANQEQLDRLLKQGVQVWNEWIAENLDVQIDLRYANLTRANLTNATLRYATLRNATLTNATLSNANLFGAELRYADLRNATLSGATLTGAILFGARLSGATLTGAILGNANLSGATLNEDDLRGVTLSGATLNEDDLRGVTLGYTVFGDVDLSTVKGLETVNHFGPSTIGIDTIYRSQGKIPEVFLKGAGVPDSFLDYMRSLVGKPIDYYSCFISHSSKDEAIVKRLYADLQSNHVRVSGHSTFLHI